VRLLYKPLGILLGMFSGLIAKRIFKALWSAVDDHEPPSATTEGASWGRALTASALRALTFSLTRDAVQRIGAQSFRHLTGIWPGERPPSES
jgi:hypothetical protein